MRSHSRRALRSRDNPVLVRRSLGEGGRVAIFPDDEFSHSLGEPMRHFV